MNKDKKNWNEMAKTMMENQWKCSTQFILRIRLGISRLFSKKHNII